MRASEETTIPFSCAWCAPARFPRKRFDIRARWAQRLYVPRFLCMGVWPRAAPWRRMPTYALFVIRYFETRVIVATAIIYLPAPANGALYPPCLDEKSVITWHPWPEGISLLSNFAMYLAELLA